MFDQKGQIIIDKEECEMDADELMMTALDAGAEDFNEEEDSYEAVSYTHLDVYKRQVLRGLPITGNVPRCVFSGKLQAAETRRGTFWMQKRSQRR